MPIEFPKPGSARQSSSLPQYQPSESSSDEYDEDERSAMIQEEWEESMRQLETMLSILILPFFGRWYGRRWAYWAWEKYELVRWTNRLWGHA